MSWKLRKLFWDNGLLSVIVKPYALNKCLEILTDYLEYSNYSLESRVHNRDKNDYIPKDVYATILKDLRGIVRWFNKIQFATQKTLRVMNLKSTSSLERSELYYSVYCMQWKHVAKRDLKQEFKDLHATISDPTLPAWNALLFQFIEKFSQFSWKIAFKNLPNAKKISITHAVPSFFVERLLPVLTEKKINANAQAMNPFKDRNFIALRIILDQATLDTDGNGIMATRETYRDILHQNGIKAKLDTDIPFLLHIPIDQRKLVSKSPLYQAHKIIFQDKSAVIACLIVDPQPSELILDVTAAPGMKTRLLQELTNHQSVIIGGDIHQTRLKKTKQLLDQLNTPNVHLIQWDGAKLPLRLEVSSKSPRFDKILIDAPCSGSGTFLTDPEMKWHQNRRILLKNVIIQEKLLKQLKKYIQKGTTVVYATCSLYPDEGEYQFNRLIHKPWFQELIPQPLRKGISPPYFINDELTALLSTEEKHIIGLGRLFPAKQHTQGFFFAKFTRP